MMYIMLLSMMMCDNVVGYCTVYGTIRSTYYRTCWCLPPATQQNYHACRTKTATMMSSISRFDRLTSYGTVFTEVNNVNFEKSQEPSRWTAICSGITFPSSCERAGDVFNATSDFPNHKLQSCDLNISHCTSKGENRVIGR